jgi:hypothetical protein
LTGVSGQLQEAMEAIPPTGYYQINYRAIRLFEIARINGFWKAPFAYWAMRGMAPGNPCWMPGTSAEYGCSREELSPRALANTEKECAAFASLGFVEVSCSKMRNNLNLAFLDNAGFHFLNPEQGTIAVCVYSLTAIGVPGASPLENKALAFTAVLENGAFSCSNEKKVFDPIPGSIVVRMKSADPVEIYQRFTTALKRYESRRIALRSTEEHLRWTDQQAINSFVHNVRRKLYVPMSEEEVIKAKRTYAASFS